MKFLTDKPAMIVEDTLVIGDLHLGIEYELYRSGFSLPSTINKILKLILSIIKETNVKRLILLGDVKHNVPEISFQESKEIPIFLGELSKLIEVHIVPGNHDGKIEDITPKSVVVHSRRGFLLNDAYFNHGHTWPGNDFIKAKTLVMAHIHPAVEFLDSLGYRYIEPCWLKCKLDSRKMREKYKTKVKCKEAIIIPAFNPIITGTPVNRENENQPTGPLIKNRIINLKKCEVYLLDGTYLGEVDDLQINKKRKKRSN